jgi:hypothetical protein
MSEGIENPTASAASASATIPIPTSAAGKPGFVDGGKDEKQG